MKGEKKRGGFRIGEMETNVMISSGVSSIVKDRLMEQSDKYEVPFCKKCGFMAQKNYEKYNKYFHLFDNCQDLKHYCRHCKTGKHVVDIFIPYPAKLCMQEIASLGISTKLKFNEH